jgi:DNA-formamidopyrimidine glycosylase
MPEGHTVHRTAREFNARLAGRNITVDSPQGRFLAEANLIDGHTLVRARAIGKQLFLEFDNALTCRIHLGIYGKWRFENHAGDVSRDGQVRARFYSEDFLADLRGPTVCEVIDRRAVKQVEARLGPDPINPDPKSKAQAKFIARIQASKTPIGQLLMNQDVVSGIGNVYRAELLFRAGISPHRPGNSLTIDELTALWLDAVKLMRVGVRTGFMITRDELFTRRPAKADRNFVYKREGLPCRVCGTNISIEIMATRKLYWCVGCQK